MHDPHTEKSLKASAALRENDVRQQKWLQNPAKDSRSLGQPGRAGGGGGKKSKVTGAIRRRSMCSKNDGKRAAKVRHKTHNSRTTIKNWNIKKLKWYTRRWRARQKCEGTNGPCIRNWCIHLSARILLLENYDVLAFIPIVIMLLPARIFFSPFGSVCAASKAHSECKQKRQCQTTYIRPAAVLWCSTEEIAFGSYRYRVELIIIINGFFFCMPVLGY